MLEADHGLTLGAPADLPVAAQGAVDGRWRQREQGRDPVGTPALRLADPEDVQLLGGRESLSTPVWTAAAIDERGRATRLPAWPPAVVPAPAHPEHETGGTDRRTRGNGVEDRRPTTWRQARIGMTMHRGALPVVELSALLNLAGDGLLFVTNLVEEQS